MKRTFIIHAIPKAQGRARAARFGKFVKIHDDPKSAAYKENFAAQVAMQKPVLMLEPLKVTLLFFLPRPKGHYKKSGELTKSAPAMHSSKPDIDNLQKAALDALKGICWRDDTQIWSISATKSYSTEPMTQITIEEEVTL